MDTGFSLEKKKRAYFVLKNAHAGLRDRHISKYRSNERVTCVVLIECGLSLKGVAGVDQEGPPGEGGTKAGFEETTEFLR